MNFMFYDQKSIHINIKEFFKTSTFCLISNQWKSISQHCKWKFGLNKQKGVEHIRKGSGSFLKEIETESPSTNYKFFL